MPLLRIAIANNARKSEYTYITKGFISHVDFSPTLYIDRMIHGYVYRLFIS